MSMNREIVFCCAVGLGLGLGAAAAGGLISKKLGRKPKVSFFATFACLSFMLPSYCIQFY